MYHLVMATQFGLEHTGLTLFESLATSVTKFHQRMADEALCI